MNETLAKEWIAARHGGSAVDRLSALVDLVIEENSRQNLIAPSTVPMIWQRHVVDSVQLLQWDQPGSWIDIGTGGGFPGLAVAILRADPVIMVEPRAKRAAFLQECVGKLGLATASVAATKVEKVAAKGTIISARAVASLDRLFAAAHHCAGERCRWLLPKGRSAGDDLQEARGSWFFMFHVEQSVSDSEGQVIVAEELRRK
jgi:16S rRNA (guanine527-N7)-methyltransferase